MGVAVPYESKSRAEPAKMKFLAVLLLVALAYAEPEAAPDAKADAEAAPWYYGYYDHPYALAHPAVTYAAPVAPTVAVKPYTYYANSGGAVHIVKRDAEAKPEAEAEASPESWYYGYYGHPYRWGGYYGGWGGYYGRRWGYGYWG